jgi:hypothetical protein
MAEVSYDVIEDHSRASDVELPGNSRQERRNGLDGRGSGKKRPERPNEANKLCTIKELTARTNPNEPKTKPVSPLDLICLLKRTQIEATKSFKFGGARKRTQLWGMAGLTD